MRLKDYDSKDGKRVWLSESEIGLLLDNTDPNHVEMRIAFVLAARCGLRRQEIVDVAPAHLVENDTGPVVRVLSLDKALTASVVEEINRTFCHCD